MSQYQKAGVTSRSRTSLTSPFKTPAECDAGDNDLIGVYASVWFFSKKSELIFVLLVFWFVILQVLLRQYFLDLILHLIRLSGRGPWSCLCSNSCSNFARVNFIIRCLALLRDSNKWKDLFRFPLQKIILSLPFQHSFSRGAILSLLSQCPGLFKFC